MTFRANRNGKSGPPEPGAAFPQHERGTWRLNATNHAILITYYKICVKGKNHYCEPRPNTVIGLLQKYQKIEIGRRWFFQCCRNLEDAGILRRKRRWTFPDEGGIESISSLWWFTLRGLKYLKAKMVYGANDLVRRTIDWLHRNDRRSPGPSDIFPGEEITDRETALARLQELIQGILHEPAGG